jgi:hypothetical protein
MSVYNITFLVSVSTWCALSLVFGRVLFPKAVVLLRSSISAENYLNSKSWLREIGNQKISCREFHMRASSVFCNLFSI